MVDPIVEPVVKASAEEISNGTARAFGGPQKAGVMPTPATPATPAPVEPVAATPNTPVVPGPQTAPETPVAAAPSAAEISDEQFEMELAKRTKGKIKSLSDLNPPAPKSAEEIQAAIEKEKQDAFQWALANGKTKQEDYDKAILGRAKTNREIALNLFSEEVLAINSKATPAEIEEQFKDAYGEELDEDSPLRKLRQRQMDKLADEYRAAIGKDIDNIEPAYKEYQQSLRHKADYDKQVDEVLQEAPAALNFPVKYTNAAGAEVEMDLAYEIEPSDLKQLKKDMRSEGIYQSMGGAEREFKKAELQEAFNYNLKALAFDKMIAKIASDAANKAAMDTAAHYKSIPARQPNPSGAPPDSSLSTKKMEFTQSERSRFPSKRI